MRLVLNNYEILTMYRILICFPNAQNINDNYSP